jgi:Tfp pilus assembly protein PilN
MGYKRWRPSSRRDRRRNRAPRRSVSQEADKTFFLYMGLFVLILILILAALVFLGS